MLTTLNLPRTYAPKSFMSTAVSLGSRSLFNGASMMERNAQAETARRERGPAGKLMWGDCGAGNALENLPHSASAAQAVVRTPIKVRRLMDKANPPNYRKEDIRFIWRTRESAQVAPVVEFVGVFGPAVADVGAVVHVGNQNVFDAGINLGLGLFHGLSNANYYENHA